MIKKKSLITAISISKEIDNLLDRLQNRSHKSRSELLREMITFYVGSAKTSAGPKPGGEYIDDSDANNVLKLYYKLLSQSKPKPTLVVGSAIISKHAKVIIGLRKTTDPQVRDLHWTFPSGKMENLNFEDGVIKTANRETGFKIKVLTLVHARVYPDSPRKTVRIVVLYYH